MSDTEGSVMEDIFGAGPSDDEDVPKAEATVSLLKAKKKNTATTTLVVSDEDGNPVEVELRFEAISAPLYDKMQMQCPPKPEHRKMGLTYNPDKFGPKLIAATCVSPEMSEEDATEIWNSENWNRGERMQLLSAAIEACTGGLKVPFSLTD